jgi:DNA-binding NarL/FixJ family response regulator
VTAAETADRKGTLLLVEDERDTRELLAQALTRAGYACLTAADAEAGLRAATSASALDIVVTDVVLGRADHGGLDLLTALRANGVRAPVVVITAYADVEKVKLALNGGATHLLEKPFRAAELVAVVDRVRADAEHARGGASMTAAQAIEQVLARARLTAKERTVAIHLLNGLSSNEIAELEANSPKTIRQHVTQIYAKCGVETRAELFRLAYAR